MVKWVSLAILLLPFIELGVFALVASAIGLGLALALALGTSLLGAIVLRAAGRGQLVKLRVAASDPELAAFQAMAGGMLVVLGGFLLLLPGFVTDTIGLLLLLAPVRRLFGRGLRRASGAGPRQRRGEEVVDLTPEEWARVPDPELEHHRPDRRPPPREPPESPERPDRTSGNQ